MNESDKPKATTRHNNYFVELPEEFTTLDLVKIIQKYGGVTQPSMAIHLWKKDGLIEKLSRNHYRKIKKR